MDDEKKSKIQTLFRTKKMKISITFFITLLIVISFVWFSYSKCDKFPKSYDINEVSIYCYLSTMIGRYDIVIYGNGSAYYLSSFDQDFEAKAGKFSQEKIQEIIELFKEKQFFCMDENYDSTGGMTDAGTDYVSITINNVTKTVDDYGRSAPSSFREIVNKLKNSVNDLPNATEDNSIELCNAIMNGFAKQGTNYADWTEWCLYCVNASISQ